MVCPRALASFSLKTDCPFQNFSTAFPNDRANVSSPSRPLSEVWVMPATSPLSP
ncbi:hypothetical protein Barb4_05246 [Bacteroidales bacterium Barb4]|nr:hypothetical protein Barb4_05246 [Bacteroidales bacterium Barb4]